ncbi:hypothetical protein MSAN_00756200 [Mycena sanguinolenta]|uniref:Transmembrane protein n=1 Tax=Mycena sanguinolenta TaxID=230812 RepID=A0A8H6Z6G5_9AGAR|nr:hypothetical protein MSAN_00756200 [Mycena sanguinolenta]
MATTTKSKAKYTLLPSAPDEADALLDGLSPAASTSQLDLPSSLPDDFDMDQLDAELALLEGGSRPRRDRAAQTTFPPTIDPRFVQHKPAAWKRVALLLFIGLCFYVAVQLQAHVRQRKAGGEKHEPVGITEPEGWEPEAPADEGWE